MKKIYAFMTSNQFIVLLLFFIIGYQVFLHRRINEVRWSANRTGFTAQDNQEIIRAIADHLKIDY
ncbi:hypothetical protein [Spirosoma flavus]